MTIIKKLLEKVTQLVPMSDFPGQHSSSGYGNYAPHQQQQPFMPNQHDPYAFFPSETILSLVSIAENSSTNWRDQLNYIEDINDGRGFTISIVGFCTGTGDFLMVVERIQQLDPYHPLVSFLPALRKVNGTPSHSGLEKLPSVVKSMGQNNQIYNQAVYDIVKQLYWDRAVQFCARKHLPSPLSQYIVYDTILNFGELDEFEHHHPSNEYHFLTQFLDLKQRIIERGGNFGDTKDNRVEMQKSLLQSGNFGLVSPMYVRCYGDNFTL